MNKLDAIFEKVGRESDARLEAYVSNLRGYPVKFGRFAAFPHMTRVGVRPYSWTPRNTCFVPMGYKSCQDAFKNVYLEKARARTDIITDEYPDGLIEYYKK